MFKNIYHTTYKLISKIILILHPNKYNLTEQVFVDSKLRQYKSSLKNLLTWSYNPISIFTFLNFLILNFILYWVYLFFLYYFIIYWVFWFTYYRFNTHIVELKPSEDLQSWRISVRYSFIHICYLQTFDKGYLNSFNLLYLLCYFCKKKK
jgi:hypothetical protein